MNFHSLSKRQWVLLSVSVVIVGVAFWALQAGYLPEIGKFFAAEPGYVPSCAWYGEPVTPTQQCCSGFVPVPVTYAMPSPIPSYILNAGDVVGQPVLSSLPPRTISPTPTKTPPPPSYTPTPTPMPARYCVLPGCQAVQRQVYCIKAPCPPIVDIVCPSGITPPPPRPTYTPTPTPVYRGIRIDRPLAGGTVVLGDASYTIAWTMDTDIVGTSYPKGPVDILLGRVGGPSPTSYIARGVPNQGWFNWDTTKPGSLADGTPIDFMNMTTGPDFVIYVRLQGTINVGGQSDAFSIIRGPTPSSTSTVTPPPPYSKVLLNLGGPTGQVQPVTPGTQITIPVNLVTRGTVVTGIDFTGSLGGSAQITGAAIGSAHFPEILRDSVYSNNNHLISFALGSGAGGGWATAEDIATITVTIDKTAQPGSTIEFINTPMTEITAAGIDSNVFGGGTPARFTVVALPSKPGDANGDGKVDIFDYNLVVSNFGKTGTNVPGDVNKDGKVDIFDYNLVISNFGK